MKVNLQQALTGRSLRNDIFNTIGQRSLHSLSALLRRSRQRESRYLPYSSQHTLLQAESPISRVHPCRPLSPSPPHALLPAGRARPGRDVGGQGATGKVQRMKGRQVSSKSKNKSRNKSAPRYPPSEAGERKGKLCSRERVWGGSSSPSKSRNNPSSKGKSSSKQRRSSSSRRSRKSKLDLSSIIQRGQEVVVTPSSHTRRERSRKSGEKTHKKGRKEEMTTSICRRMERLCKEPGKFVRVMKSELLTVRVRVQRRRIIELEVLTHKEIPRLAVTLDSGNLDCQHVEERFLALPAGSRLALFSCVRAVDLDRPCSLPRLHLEAVLDDGTLLDRRATIPFSWLLLATAARPHPRSRIVTKACLEDAPLDPQRLRALMQTLPGWRSRHSRGESEVSSEFSVGEEGVGFVVRETGGGWRLEVVGRGEGRLQGLLGFLSAFLRPC